MSAISFEELGQLTGEMLPERAVLSTVNPFRTEGGDAGAGAGSDAHSSAVALGGGMGGGDSQATVVSACQATDHQGTAGLIGALGLGAQAPANGITCVPAAVAN